MGAEVVRVDRDVIDEEFWRWVNEEAVRSGGAINLNQFENVDNPEGHYYVTGEEIVRQFRSVGKVPRVLIAGIGTGGHITGIARSLGMSLAVFMSLVLSLRQVVQYLALSA